MTTPSASTILGQMRAADLAFERHAAACDAARIGLDCLECWHLDDAGLRVADLWIKARESEGVGQP